MINLLVFTPTYADKLQPLTVKSVVEQQFDGRLTWEIGRYNPHPPPNKENVLAQYQRGRELFLAADYDALLLVEHDMVLPPDTVRKLVSVGAPVVYAPYMLRHGSGVLSCWRYENHHTMGMSLSLYPAELAFLRKSGVGQVSGVGFGCTLIQREIVKRFAFRSTPETAPDIPFASDCVQAGVLQVCCFDAPCGHVDEEQEGVTLEAYELAGGSVARVLALQDVTVNVEGASHPLVKDKYYTLPVSVAQELARAGYVKITNDAGRETTEAPAERETTTEPKTKKRSGK